MTQEKKLQIYQALEEKILRLNPELGVSFPNITENKKYQKDDASFWTKGFWPGMLWHLYQCNKKEELADTARAIEERLDEILHEFYTIHHDAGFVWSLSAVADYKLTGNEESKRRGLIAASHLAGRFNVKGNFIRAWNARQGKDNEGWAIIDCTMNLPLLYWASKETGDPRFRHIANAHADTVVNEFSKADGSTYHIVCFDPETGVRVGQKAGQGAFEESAWSRGQAWIIYGMALCYRYTKKAKYLRTAMAAADFFLKNLPKDGIPYWDFKVEPGKDVPKDTSAAACAACGMLEIASHLQGKEQEKYQEGAEDLIQALYEQWWETDPESHGLLGGGTFNCPKGKGIHVSLIYGDYFFTEAVTRLMGAEISFW